MQQNPYQAPKINKKWLDLALFLLVLSVIGLIVDQQDTESTQHEAIAHVEPSLSEKRPSEKAVPTQEVQIAADLPKPEAPPSVEVMPQREAEQWYAQARGYMHSGDWKEAVPWLEKAAEAGHWKAQNNLGVAYMEGRGVGKDEQLGYMWIERAAKNSLDDKVLENLSMCSIEASRPIDAETMDLFKKKKEESALNDEFALAKMYLHGHSEAKDAAKGLYWLGKAAINGHKHALVALSDCFSLRRCSQQYYDPAIAYALLVRANQSISSDLSWWGRLKIKWAERRMWSNLSSSDQKYAEEYLQEWTEWDDAAMVKHMMAETGLASANEK